MARWYGRKGAHRASVLGGYFVSSFLAYERNEIERFERFVTDWEFREYAYHL
jgi:glutamine synthetase